MRRPTMAEEPVPTCACHDPDDEHHPELDARRIPAALRPGSVLGAVAGLAPGQGMVLVAPHDPLPLLDRMQERYGDALEVVYLDRDPGAWRLQLVRRG